jgi:hypothetical protein
MDGPGGWRENRFDFDWVNERLAGLPLQYLDLVYLRAVIDLAEDREHCKRTRRKIAARMQVLCGTGSEATVKRCAARCERYGVIRTSQAARFRIVQIDSDVLLKAPPLRPGIYPDGNGRTAGDAPLIVEQLSSWEDKTPAVEQAPALSQAPLGASMLDELKTFCRLLPRVAAYLESLGFPITVSELCGPGSQLADPAPQCSGPESGAVLTRVTAGSDPGLERSGPGSQPTVTRVQTQLPLRDEGVEVPRTHARESSSLSSNDIYKDHSNDDHGRAESRPGSADWPKKISYAELGNSRTLQDLYELAVAKPWGLIASEQLRLDFFRLAFHCREKYDLGKLREPGSLFTSLVKQKRWQGGIAAEQTAKAAIKRLDGRDPSPIPRTADLEATELPAGSRPLSAEQLKAERESRRLAAAAEAPEVAFALKRRARPFTAEEIQQLHSRVYAEAGAEACAGS